MKSIIVKLYIYIYPCHLFFDKLNSQTHTMHDIYSISFFLIIFHYIYFFLFLKKILNALKHNVKQKKTRTVTFQKKWIKVVPNQNLEHILHPKE